MSTNNIFKSLAMGTVVIALAACSSTKTGSGSGFGGEDGRGNGSGASAYGAENGAYGQGAGGHAGGYFNGAHCSAPQNAESYYFDFNSNTVYSQDRSRLQAAAQNAASSNSKVRVVGNTDNRGSREYNVALGWRRADAVSSVLEQHGVNKQQIVTTSNGAEKPIAYGNSEEDFQCNRRVDLKSGN